MSDIQIRFAGPEDLAAVLEMTEELLGYEHSIQPGGAPSLHAGLGDQLGNPRLESLRDDLEDVLADEGRYRRVCCVAGKAGRLVGYAIGSVTADEEIKQHREVGRRISVLHQLYVAENTRGQGVGGALIEAVRLWAIGRRADYLGFTVLRNNTSAIAFYQSQGYLGPVGQREGDIGVTFFRYLPKPWW